MRIPTRGLVLIRKPEVSKQPGAIVLLDKTVANWTEGQAEVLAVGAPPLCDEDADPFVVDRRIQPAAWVLTRFRRWIATDQPKEFLIRVEDIVGVFGD